MENREECNALERYIKYCLESNNPSILADTYGGSIYCNSFDVSPRLIIVKSHYEESNYSLPHLYDWGYWLLRVSRNFQELLVLVLYEKIGNILPKEWQYLLPIPWNNVKLSDRIRIMIDESIKPTEAEIEQLNSLYPPINKDHHHHRR